MVQVPAPVPDPHPAPSAAAPMGSRVRIQGLLAKPHLNGWALHGVPFFGGGILTSTAGTSEGYKLACDERIPVEPRRLHRQGSHTFKLKRP